MAEPTTYKKVSTKPKTRVSSTLRADGTRQAFEPVQDRTTPKSAAQYFSNTRTGGAFTPPTTADSTTVPGANAKSAPLTTTPPTVQDGGMGTFTSAATGNTASNEHLYGFAKDHFALTDMPTVWQNPWLIVNAFLKDKGMATPRMQEELRKYGDIGLPLFTMLNGLTDDPSDLSSAATINWISRWLNSMTTPGGNVPGYEQLLGNLLSARGNDTLLGEALNSGTGTDQVNTLMTYLRSALGTNTLNPIAASAILSQANREGDNFLGATMGGQDGYTRNFTDWLNSGGHRLFGDPRF